MSEQSTISQTTELGNSLIEEALPSDVRLKSLSDSIARIRKVNHKLDSLIMSRLESLPLEKQHEILRKRAEAHETKEK